MLEGANANIQFGAAAAAAAIEFPFYFQAFVYLFVIFFNDKQFIGVVNARENQPASTK